MAGMTMPGEVTTDYLSPLAEQEVRYVGDSSVLPPMDSVEEVMNFYAAFVLTNLVFGRRVATIPCQTGLRPPVASPGHLLSTSYGSLLAVRTTFFRLFLPRRTT